MDVVTRLIADVLGGLSRASRLSFRPFVLVLPAMAAITAGLALSGADAAVNRVASALMPETFSILWSAPALLAGMVIPLFLPLLFSLLPAVGRYAPRVWASAIVSLTVVSILKAITGRVHPESSLPVDLYERSVAFTLMSGEVFEGWPSGHVATNAAVALAIAGLPIAPVWRGLAVGWAVWVAAAVVFGINGEVHWLSDMVSGAILAFACHAALSSVDQQG